MQELQTRKMQILEQQILNQQMQTLKIVKILNRAARKLLNRAAGKLLNRAAGKSCRSGATMLKRSQNRSPAENC